MIITARTTNIQTRSVAWTAGSWTPSSTNVISATPVTP